MNNNTDYTVTPVNQAVAQRMAYLEAQQEAVRAHTVAQPVIPQPQVVFPTAPASQTSINPKRALLLVGLVPSMACFAAFVCGFLYLCFTWSMWLLIIPVFIVVVTGAMSTLIRVVVNALEGVVKR